MPCSKQRRVCHSKTEFVAGCGGGGITSVANPLPRTPSIRLDLRLRSVGGHCIYLAIPEPEPVEINRKSQDSLKKIIITNLS